MADVIRKRITFHGWVQGVGFRYRACHAADHFGCTGFVWNAWDGSVGMEIQGTETAIDQVILTIGQGTFVRIESMDCKTIPVIDGEHSFRIRAED